MRLKWVVNLVYITYILGSTQNPRQPFLVQSRKATGIKWNECKYILIGLG